MPNSLTPPNLDAQTADALAKETEAAKEAGALGFMARAMVQATLPHKKVDGGEFMRRNGDYYLIIMAPSIIGLPYGSVPRLLLSWVTTEAVRTRSRELELGDSLSEYMRELGLVPTGGRWGSITRLKDQTTRLFASSVSMLRIHGHGTNIMNRLIADETNLWWDGKKPDQAGLWKSNVVLGEHFYNEIIDRPVPIDMRAIRELKRSPMALDAYTWLTYRMSYLSKPTTIPWGALASQFGSNYGELRNFRAAFITELRKVVSIYGAARVQVVERGLELRPSQPHIAMK